MVPRRGTYDLETALSWLLGSHIESELLRRYEKGSYRSLSRKIVR